MAFEPVLRCTAGLLLVVLGCTSGDQNRGYPDGPPPCNPDFEREVRPLLARHCFGCHGADESTRALGLRLDTSAGVFEPRPNGRPPVIVKGNSTESPVMQRIEAPEEARMPPAASGPRLTREEVALLECWIDSGADYPDRWVLVAPARPMPPSVAHTSFVANPIDAFIARGLEDAGLEPAPPAEPRGLLRRVSLDLRGLPPTPEELEGFSTNPSEAAYLELVDRMLAEPSFGEHRAHYWLDAVRYADTHGFNADGYRSIWPYRDYVINAFNAGKPFDQFSIEQIAGDLLPNASIETQTATGFIRNAMSTSEPGVVLEEYAALYAKDRVETLAEIWLGLTVGCAACHDHKYDPVTQREFYALTAYFRNSSQPILDDNLPDAPPSVLVPPSLTPTLVTAELPGEPYAHVLAQGRFDAPGERVTAGVPAALPPLPDGAPNNRLGLAQWLMSPDHPLVARVTVNRFWAEVFGAGLVATAHDFGAAGAVPSHPELLDWLAVEFRESGWNVKHLFRLMVTSSTYRQASVATADKLATDPENRLLSRGPRFRMDGEMIRDLALASSGLLVSAVGGPSVKPYQPDGVWESVSLNGEATAHYQQDTGEALYRRSVYTFWKRAAPPPALVLFDAPTRQESVVQRDRVNSPLQALVTMNDIQFVEAARHLAMRAIESSVDSSQRLHTLAVRVLGRPLVADETVLMHATLEGLLQKYSQAPDLAALLIAVGDSPEPSTVGAGELAAWTLVASTFLNLDEALNK